MQKFDLVIVGGGILGVSHAYHAVSKGLNVLLLEKDNFPVGSTVRNFGQIVPSGMAGRWFAYGVESTEIYKNIQQQLDISVSTNGSIYVASDDQELALINDLYDHHKTTNYPCQLLSKSDCLTKYPRLKNDYTKGGLYFPEEVSVEPNILIYKMLNYLIEIKKLNYKSDSTVISCETQTNGVVITTALKEKYRASKVLICSGYNFNLLYPEIFKNSGLVVSKLQMLQTVPMPEIPMQGNILTGLTIRRYESFEAMPSYKNIHTPQHYEELKKWGIHILFKQASDGSFIVGDSHEYATADKIDELGFDTKEMIDELILAEAERIVDFPVRKIARKWAGFYAQHPDEIFEHDVDKNIHICTGIGGKGMTSSLGFAKISLQEKGII